MKLSAEGFKTRLVIRRNTMRYERAIAGAFTAQALAPPSEAWELFTHMLIRKGRARITVLSTLWHAENMAGRLEGEFVALTP